MIRIFTSLKNPTTSAEFEPANLGSRGDHVTPRPPRPTTGSVTDPFLTTFYYVEKRNGILRKNRGEGFEKSYMGVGGGQKIPKSSLRN